MLKDYLLTLVSQNIRENYKFIILSGFSSQRFSWGIYKVAVYMEMVNRQTVGGIVLGGICLPFAWGESRRKSLGVSFQKPN